MSGIDEPSITPAHLQETLHGGSRETGEYNVEWESLKNKVEKIISARTVTIDIANADALTSKFIESIFNPVIDPQDKNSYFEASIFAQERLLSVCLLLAKKAITKAPDGQRTDEDNQPVEQLKEFALGMTNIVQARILGHAASRNSNNEMLDKEYQYFREEAKKAAEALSKLDFETIISNSLKNKILESDPKQRDLLLVKWSDFIEEVQVQGISDRLIDNLYESQV